MNIAAGQQLGSKGKEGLSMMDLIDKDGITIKMMITKDAIAIKTILMMVIEGNWYDLGYDMAMKEFERFLVGFIFAF